MTPRTRKQGRSATGATVLHANRYDGLTWCDAREDWAQDDAGIAVLGETAPPENLDAVTCVECLRRIVAYGDRAVSRLRGVLG